MSAFSAIQQVESDRAAKKQRKLMEAPEQDAGGYTAEYEPRERQPRAKREGTMRSRAAAKQDTLYKPTFKL